MNASPNLIEIADDKYYDDEEFENTDTVSISNNLSQPAIDSESTSGAQEKGTFQHRQDVRNQPNADPLPKRVTGEDSTTPSDRIPFQNVVETKDAPLYQTDSKATDRRSSPRIGEVEQNEEKSSRNTDSEKSRLNARRPHQSSVIVNDDEEDESGSADGIDSEEDTEYDAELLVAAYHGDVAKVVKLIRLGARYDARDRHRWTALMWAAAGGYDDVIEALIGCVKRPLLHRYLNAKDNITGWTALHVSLMHVEYGIKSMRTDVHVYKKDIILSLSSSRHLKKLSFFRLHTRSLARKGTGSVWRFYWNMAQTEI
jgi:Ankyrin repeats (3 copies)